MVYDDQHTNFAILPKYVEALVQFNPRNVVQFLHHPCNSNSIKIFKYVFQEFGSIINAFQTCRLVVSIDGTHLHGEYKRKLLVAMTLNANNRILPLAFAIIDEETKVSWAWFLQQFYQFVVRGRYLICIISDRHSGICNAIKNDEYLQEPFMYYRLCLRYV